MTIQRLSVRDAAVLRNPGKRSEQFLWPQNAPDCPVTVTRATMEPGAVSETHSHARSEQIWIVEQGSGVILLGDGKQTELGEGDIIRTPPGVTHGIVNTGAGPLVYLSITTPPEDFSALYKDRDGQAAGG